MTHLKVGDRAPDFNGITEKGTSVALSDFASKKLILFIYPKDFTGGCTTVACNLRDNYTALKAKGLELLGVSPDTSERHQEFISEHTFPFPLLADTDRQTIKAYGCWGPRIINGEEREGVYRTTFLIGDNSKILAVFSDVNKENHTNQILKALDSLGH